MRSTNFSLQIASDLDRDLLCVEIFYKDDMWAEVSIQQEEFIVAFCSPMKTKFWEFKLDEALEALNRAKKILVE